MFKAIKFLAIGLILILFSSNNVIAQVQENWVLVWHDEFEVDGLPDANKWFYEIGNGCPNLCGWGNNELQYYTAGNLENTRVKDGVLIIEAHQQKIKQYDYTSAKLNSTPSGIWLYGKIEVKAKLPSGHGVWPAIWMLPSEWQYGAWPNSGEIDIMEHVGHNMDSIFGTVHTGNFNHKKGTQKGASFYTNNLSEVFHVYSIEWTVDKIDFFIDDQNYYTFKKRSDNAADWPFDRHFYLILNLAVGGDWGAQQGVDPFIWPQRLEIDYVRVYQHQKS